MVIAVIEGEGETEKIGAIKLDHWLSHYIVFC